MAIACGLGVSSLACAGRAHEPVPLAEPGSLAARLQRTAAPDVPTLVEFRWTYRGREGRLAGDGGVRVNPPDSVRLDLLGPGWSGVQSAVLLGDRVTYIGEQRVELPPPTFLWALFGIFRPPAGTEPTGQRRDDRPVLRYRVSARESVAFHFDATGRLREAEWLDGARTVRRIRLTHGGSGPGSGWHWPDGAMYRDLWERHEVRVEVTAKREHEPFERDIFRVADP